MWKTENQIQSDQAAWMSERCDDLWVHTSQACDKMRPNQEILVEKSQAAVPNVLMGEAREDNQSAQDQRTADVHYHVARSLWCTAKMAVHHRLLVSILHCDHIKCLTYVPHFVWYPIPKTSPYSVYKFGIFKSGRNVSMFNMFLRNSICVCACSLIASLHTGSIKSQSWSVIHRKHLWDWLILGQVWCMSHCKGAQGVVMGWVQNSTGCLLLIGV